MPSALLFYSVNVPAASADVYATWQLSNAAVSGGGDIGDPGPSWSYEGVGDFKGDGGTDMLFRRQDGTLALLGGFGHDDRQHGDPRQSRTAPGRSSASATSTATASPTSCSRTAPAISGSGGSTGRKSSAAARSPMSAPARRSSRDRPISTATVDSDILLQSASGVYTDLVDERDDHFGRPRPRRGAGWRRVRRRRRFQRRRRRRHPVRESAARPVCGLDHVDGRRGFARP